MKDNIHADDIWAAGLYIGSNCPGISGTVPDYKKLSWVPERYVKCPRRVLTYVLRQENRKSSPNSEAIHHYFTDGNKI